ncbi:MAG: carbamoyltransferase HypF [Thermodesulfovibrio sp.]|uniref:carbamoyltransferase HypF n=1 Tax=Thermodesulfovibrio sp. 1176 TaxID=3043424 RepID=UPI002482B1A6|nr:carbamoyltransferase HypF [Thermodesulfovibrio sp. 1176]MDI1471390.1 carbamoyltransferase HypF [Thermodesulfovibrio sp. 1176]MDI6714583.1 carbamoyltransferase HypF [Thermodesulfovibrio sp.]
MKRLHIQVKGVVQGVGFRPFVYNLAKKLNLTGFVTNTSKGVTIEIEGEKVSEFIEKLKNEPPPLAKIYSIETKELPLNNYKDFEIIESIDDAGFTHVSEDVSICAHCLMELFDPSDRRYLYPFINCTNCGPRYTITTKVPYDRPNTTMAVFKMCPECMREYKDPSNRRFHAQPNACPVCGPQVSLLVKTKEGAKEIENPIKEAIRFIKEGKILAIRGLGGFHLCCDAKNPESIENLRKRKKRSNKPFALMSPDIESIEKFCFVSEEEKKILTSPMRPIVLLRKRTDCLLPDLLAPNNSYLGFMLPYTPLHYLLFYYPEDTFLSFRGSQCSEESLKIMRRFFADAQNDIGKVEILQSLKLPQNDIKRTSAHFEALVMTSGNISEEPIITKNEEVLEKLYNVADAFLLHNREIFMRIDDSVVRELNGKIYFIRRARGFVPKSISLKEELPEVLGAGADLKNTFTLIKSNYAIMSQHIGDMENLETLQFYEEVLKNLKSVYRIEPIALGHDLHPLYYSTQWAKEHAQKRRLQSFALQHHYCHVASIMAEYGLEELFGIAFDGTGYGTDGTIWGSEFLYCTIQNFQRLAHFKPISLPGGENAIKECSRITLSLIDDAFGEDLELIKKLPLTKVLSEEKIRQILRLKKLKQFSPLSSGLGRLFDGVSSLIGVCHYNTFEAEAAIALESLIDSGTEFSEKACYDFNFIENYSKEEILRSDQNDRKQITVDYTPMIKQIIDDFLNGKTVATVSWKFHNTIIKIIMQLSLYFKEKYGFDHVGLSGGVFQNAYLIKESIKVLKKIGLKPLIHLNFPSNDACISLGQAYIVAKRIKN